MVLIRIPNNMDLFESKKMSDLVGDGIRSRLLQDQIDDHLEKNLKKQDSLHGASQ